MTPDKEQTMGGEEPSNERIAELLEEYTDMIRYELGQPSIAHRMELAARRLRRGGGVDTWWVHLPSIEKAEEAVREVRAGRAEDEVTHGLDVAITLLSRLALEARRASLTPTPTSEKERYRADYREQNSSPPWSDPAPRRRRTMTKPDYTEELAKRLDHIQAELDNLAYELFGVNRYEEVPKFFSRVLKRARRVEEMTEHDRS